MWLWYIKLYSHFLCQVLNFGVFSLLSIGCQKMAFLQVLQKTSIKVRKMVKIVKEEGKKRLELWRNFSFFSLTSALYGLFEVMVTQQSFHIYDFNFFYRHLH